MPISSLEIQNTFTLSQFSYIFTVFLHYFYISSIFLIMNDRLNFIMALGWPSKASPLRDLGTEAGMLPRYPQIPSEPPYLITGLSAGSQTQCLSTGFLCVGWAWSCQSCAQGQAASAQGMQALGCCGRIPIRGG